MNNTKSALRRAMQEATRCHSAEERAELSLAVCRAVERRAEWGRARTVLLYHALPTEVSLASLRTDGKTVFFTPQSATSQMPASADLEAVDLVLVPGLAFTLQGDRLGRGGGWYDRLLPRLSRATLLGVCFPWQVVDSLPTEPHDVPLHALVTIE